ncbi:MAG: tetratricopeptide repeat protein [Deltaproteobacteria bacterium]|nr:tetratricopeptide repeat protein [Deltaproteobacteria bacterium]
MSFRAKRRIFHFIFFFLFCCVQPAWPQTANPYLQQAQSFNQAGKYDKAIDILFQALKNQPMNAAIHAELGKAYYSRELYQVAQESLLKSLSINANQWEAHFYLARTYAKRKMLELAASEYEQATSQNKQSAEAHFEAGRVYVQIGDLGKAKKHYSALEKMQSPRAPELMGLIDPSSIVVQ